METTKATNRQIGVLKQILPAHEQDRLHTLSKREADRLIQAHKDAWSALRPTFYQAEFLRHHGVWNEEMTRGQASDLIARIKAEEGTPNWWV